MLLQNKIEKLVQEMLDGHIKIGEALEQFEKQYILAAVERNGGHLSKTSETIGIHRNTLTKRLAAYKPAPKIKKRIKR